MKKPLLILDLDETLIYSIPKSQYKNESYDFLIEDDYYVKIRPHAESFVMEMAKHFELAVWTAATRDYAEYIVRELFKKNEIELQFFHAREQCVEKEETRVMYDYYVKKYHIKDLKKIKKNFKLDRVLMVDDLNISLVRNYGNLIKIDPFKGESDDEQLLLLKDYLISISHEDNLRKIEKRNWVVETQKKIKEIEKKKLKF